MTTNWKDLARASLEGSESGTRLAVRDAKMSAKQNDEGSTAAPSAVKPARHMRNEAKTGQPLRPCLGH
jgi:hypothetical protein